MKDCSMGNREAPGPEKQGSDNLNGRGLAPGLQSHFGFECHQGEEHPGEQDELKGPPREYISQGAGRVSG